MAAGTKLAVSARGRGIALDTRDMRQSHAMCGPASLRIVLDYFGTSLPEEVIARACRSSDKTGTTGTNLVRGARRLGFSAHIVDGADFRTIERWLVRNTPVIVDWMSSIARHPVREAMPCGHYSVACGLDRAHILLQDPAIGRRRRLSRREFANLWFDFVGIRPRREDLIIRRLIVVEAPRPTAPTSGAPARNRPRRQRRQRPGRTAARRRSP
ncbi:MAG TPA: cysteine peptidase family C39 domain-containing protein [Xanthobacteraceae bacterium]|nr:cysteine peptidase family C39 domain-containing protein [Xanthobacteraceae bacterium]